MRQQKEIAQRKKVKFQITDDLMITLGKFLDSKDGLHVNKVYFTQEGEYFYNIHIHNGEKYAKIAVEPTWSETKKAYKLSKVPKEEDKIIYEMDSDKIVDKFRIKK
jgi:hypothetical protein